MSNIDRATASEQILDAAEQLFITGVMSHSGHANLSARLDDNTYLITTKGLVRNLTENDLAVVDLEGNVIEGNIEATNLEIIDMHSVVYRSRRSAGSVIHTHSPAVLAFALAHKELACRYEALLRHGQATNIPVAPWGPRGSKESVEAIKTALSNNPDTLALILANHGLLAFSSSPLATSALIAATEEAAEAELWANGLGGSIDLPPGALEKVRESMAKARR